MYNDERFNGLKNASGITHKIIASRVRLPELAFHGGQDILTFVNEVDGASERDYLDGTRGCKLPQLQAIRTKTVQPAQPARDEDEDND